jgi:hypothetical protein
VVINENLNQARKILKKYKTEEDSEQFQNIKNIVEAEFGENKFGYLGLLTKFYFEKKITYHEISNIANKISQNRDNLKKLPKQIASYDSPEELYDDLTKLEEYSIYNKEFVSKLKGKLKNEARKDQELIEIYTNLKDDQKQDLINNFIKPKVSRYNDYKSFREELVVYINKSNLNKEEIIESIKNQNGAYLYYSDDEFIVSEVFSPQASCSLGSKSWCISTSKYYFDSYAGFDTGNKQYFVWNLKVSSLSEESLVGVTINKTGGIRTAHLKNDKLLNFRKYCDKHDLDFELFKPMDLKNDIDKISKAIGEITITMVRNLEKSNIDIKEVLQKNKDKLTNKVKMFYGLEVDYSLLEDEEKKLYDTLKGYPNLIEVINFCNQADLENPESYLRDNKSNPGKIMLDDMSFYDKIITLSKTSKEFDDDLSVKIFLWKELSEFRGGTDVELNSYGDIEFEFEMDSEFYSHQILNIEISDYITLIDGVMVDDEMFDNEINHLILNSKVKDTIIELCNFIIDYISHPDEVKIVEETKYSESGDQSPFTDRNFLNIVKRLSGDNYLEKHFDEFRDSIQDKVDDLNRQDLSQFDSEKTGEYELGKYCFLLDDMIEDFIKEGPNKYQNFEDWFDSSPSDVEKINLIADPGSYGSVTMSYLQEINPDEELDVLDENIEDLIENGFKKLSEELKLKKIIDNLIDNGWIPKSTSSRFLFGVDSVYLTYYIDENRMRIIKREDIDYDGEVKILEVDISESEYDLDDVERKIFSRLFAEEDLKGLVKEKTGQISTTSPDPDQLKLFENIKSFKQFKQIYLGRYN